MSVRRKGFFPRGYIRGIVLCGLAAVAIGAAVARWPAAPAPKGPSVTNAPWVTRSVRTPTPAPVAASPVPATVTAPTRKYLGVAEPGAGWGPYAAWQAATGTTPSIVETYIPWGDTPNPVTLALYQAHGALPLVNWDPDTTGLTQITNGSQDVYLTRFADALAGFGSPVALSFAHEFNGNWYPWGTQAQSPAAFVAAWRHVHDVLTRAGARNVVWVWTPNVVNPVPQVDLAAYWPGAAYVDWVGLVGYWTGRLGEDSWATLFGRTEQAVDRFTSDRVLIVETGAQQGAQKPGWVRQLLDGARADARLVGVVYFDYGLAQGKRADWTLGDDPAALAVWRALASGGIG